MTGVAVQSDFASVDDRSDRLERLRAMTARAERVSTLREKMRELEPALFPAVSLPTHPALASLLPGGSLRAGGVYAVRGSMSVALATLAGPSQAGMWAAAVAAPDLGCEAARGLGVELSRLVLVPHPGQRWLSVVSALVDVVPIVLVGRVGPIGEAAASKLAARLRQRESALVVLGDWPRVDATVTVVGESAVGGPVAGGVRPAGGALAAVDWQGIASGRGHLRRGRTRVEACDRAGRPVQHDVVFDGREGILVSA